MNPQHPRQYFASNHRAVAHGATLAGAAVDAIEWEELPSLAGSLAQRLVARGTFAGAPARAAATFEPGSAFDTPWNSTMAASLDMLPPSQPFREALKGLATREVHEPDVFRHFFGAQVCVA